jgi:hypothetical protein
MILLRRDRPARARVQLVRAEEAERVPATGAVGSIQEAEVYLPATVLSEIWRPEYLERLARAYWRHLNRATLGLVRIVYSDDSRAAVLLSRRLPLLRFRAPEYATAPDRGCVTWRIERGLLVARHGRDDGYLRIEVQRCPADDGAQEERLRVRLEVRNFYPWLRGGGRFARFGAWFYGQTQLRIHVLLCNAFLRSLARLDLPPSKVGALAGEIRA